MLVVDFIVFERRRFILDPCKFGVLLPRDFRRLFERDGGEAGDIGGGGISETALAVDCGKWLIPSLKF